MATRRLFDDAQVEIGSLPIVGPPVPLGSLLGSEAAAQLIRDVGTASAVQGFRADGSLHGARLSSALPLYVYFQAGDGSAQNPYSASGAPNKVWLKVGGVWKECVVWLKVSGTWKACTVYFKVAGVWKG
jgi:hypothetical protein